MEIYIAQVEGVGRIPSSRPAVIAWLCREQIHLRPRDDGAHDAYLGAKPKARAEAQRRAGMMRALRVLPDDTPWWDRVRLVK